jgi:hypothetical protein
MMLIAFDDRRESEGFLHVMEREGRKPSLGC